MSSERAGRPRVPAWEMVRSIALMAVMASCAPAGDRPPQAAPPAPRQTAQASLTSQMAGTVGLLTDALARQGIRLDVPVIPTQPGEPVGIAPSPRALRQADVHDPGGGYVLIYQFADAATTTTRAMEFADYLESGPGQINYPLDTQFSLAQVGDTLVFTWWSRERASDRELAERAYDAMAAVGQPIPITR